MEKFNDIVELLNYKSSTKQSIYAITHEVFGQFKQMLANIQNHIQPQVKNHDARVEVLYSDVSAFEAHLKFAGDTLVFMMHTNVFTFTEDHFIHDSDYVKEDPMRAYCGMIQVYNFLSDSLKYNREGDLGYLVSRIYINKDKHFFVDGRRPLSIEYNNLDIDVIDESQISHILHRLMRYCMEFDLYAPPVDAVEIISVDQKNNQMFSSGFETGKRVGFQFRSEFDPK